MKLFRHLVLALLACAAIPSHAQFNSGTVLTAAALNAALAHPTITGGTITGLSAPIGFANTAAATGTTSQLQYLQGATGSVARSLTNKLQDIINVKDFGAVGNGVADDTTAVQNAINATPPNGILYLGPYLYGISSSLSTPNAIEILGSNGGGGEYSSTCANGFRTLTANMNLFPSLASKSVIRNVCIDSNQTNTSGTAIAVGVAYSVVLDNNQINNQCTSISVSGSGVNQNKNTAVTNNVIKPYNNSACVAISIGANSTGANTGDGYYANNTIFCNNAAAGWYFHDSGGDAVVNNNVFACSYGTIIKPGANQEAIFTHFTSGVLGDYSANSDLYIDTASSSAGIASLFFTQTWTSGDGLAEAGPSVLIQNAGGASNFQGLHFIGHRSYSYTPAVDNFKISGANVKFVEVLDSHICSAVTGTGSAAGIHIASSVANTHIKNNVIGACDVGGSFPNGILVDSGSTLYAITGNDISTGTTAWGINLSGTSAATTAIIRDNLGVDNNVTTIASAATIGLFANTLYSITGTTAVTTINGMYSGRMVYLTTPSGVSFNTGGNICNAVTSASGNTVIGYWTGSCWQLK